MQYTYRFALFHCFLIHTQFLVGNTWAAYVADRQEMLQFNMFQGVAFLLYPFCGWIAEIYGGNFKMIKRSFIVSLIGLLTMAIAGVLLVTDINFVSHYEDAVYITCTLLAVVCSSVGLGMYEANAIQFGMDQMMEASSEQLSSFIHWYFWCTHVGSVLIFYTIVAGYLYISSCHVPIGYDFNHSIGFMLIVLSIVAVVVLFIVAIITHWMNTYTETSRNSLKIIFKVLKYSYHHKHPERRSAFTYWENDIPSRIDLGKEKYGGPFTYEQVEDVKTFFRLLLLIFSLFGFHLLGDGQSISHYVLNTFGCPSALPLLLLILNPQHVQFLIVLVGVPLFRCLRRYFIVRFSSMLTRLGIGLFASLLTQVVIVWYGFLLSLHKTDFQCPQTFSKYHPDASVFQKCVFSNVHVINYNGTCTHVCSDPNNFWVIYLSIVYLVLYGISYLLIFMTILEFICAQSPNALKGLLIGIWYSTTSIKYIINTLDVYPPLQQERNWNYYNGVKGVLIVVSICLFSRVCKNYRYRERNEIVNEQTIIEEQYERELLMNESVTSYDDAST